MAEEDNQSAGPIRMTAIANMMENISYKGQILARTNKVESGIMDSGIPGFMIGLFVSLILVIAPVFILGV